jgi:hypothetical protein
VSIWWKHEDECWSRLWRKLRVEAQNARAAVRNLICNTEGRLPHIAVVTGEPLPSRLASLVIGTGDISCVYHIALPELIASVDKLDLEDSANLVKIMVDGGRLKDITDLPFDLAV